LRAKYRKRSLKQDETRETVIVKTTSSLPLVTFIVVNRNTAALLERCLKHILASEVDARLEVIVVDNGSTDDSAARARMICPDAIVIEAGRNLGFAAANNLARQGASGDYLLLVNTDALLHPDCAAKLLEVMFRNPRAAMVGPQLLNEDGSRQTSYEATPTLATETLNRSLLKRLFPKRYPGKRRALDGPTEVETLIGAVMMIRTAAFDSVGGFDEGYFFFLEETDLACRLRDKGFLVIHEPRAKAVHLQGGTAKQVEAGARIEFYRSRYLFFRNRYGRLRTGILKGVLFASIALRVFGLGAANLLSLWRNKNLARKFGVDAALLRWHIGGFGPGAGLPRE
jgi:GT2 family glycosyltransferase